MKDGTLSIYKDYLEDNETIMLYRYKKVAFYRKENSSGFNFALTDVYKNILGIKFKDYYIIPKYGSSSTISYLYKYNVVDKAMREIHLSFPISKQTYINGIYNDCIYIFDKSNLTQYKIDVDKELQTIVGNEETEGINVVNGEETPISVYSLNESNVVFTYTSDDYNSLGCNKVYNVNKKYSICEKNNEYYKVYSTFIDSPIFLFSDEDIKDLKIENDNIYYLKGDSIYRYNKYGTMLLVTDKEFNYNYENVFDIYFE